MRFKRKKPSLVERLLRGVVLFIVLATAAAAIGGWQLARWAKSPMPLSEAVDIDFKRGTTLADLSHQLNEHGALDKPLFFHLWVKVFSDYGRFQAGLYRFKESVSPAAIAQTIIAGKIYEPIILQYTIPEGFTFKQIARRLASNGVGEYSQIVKYFDNQTFIQSLNLPSKTLEGFFYPATYQFVRMITPQEAIRHGVQAFWERLPPHYEQNVQEKGLTLLEAVTFASLIELETKHIDEKAKISEVIWRRLKNQEPLGIDAAIIYGITDYDGDIKWRHLKDRKNRYNSRIHKGLPPTPIASPDTNSLAAVLNPTNEGYYYYVYDVDTVDRHHFSKTLAEHNRYVKKLVSATRGKRE